MAPQPNRTGALCFDFDGSGWEILRSGRDSRDKAANPRGWTEVSAVKMQQLPRVVRPNPNLNPNPDPDPNSNPNPNQVRNDGWTFTEWEPASRTPFKPGIAAKVTLTLTLTPTPTLTLALTPTPTPTLTLTLTPALILTLTRWPARR